MNATTFQTTARNITKPGGTSVVAALWRRLRSHWRHESACAVVCESGVVWVTVENDARDYLVRAGETLCLTTSGRIVAQGLSEAVFRVEKCEA